MVDHVIAEQIKVDRHPVPDLKRQGGPAGQIKIIERGERREKLRSLFSVSASGVHASKWIRKREVMRALGFLV